jgi:hypothetical protein
LYRKLLRYLFLISMPIEDLVLSHGNKIGSIRRLKMLPATACYCLLAFGIYFTVMIYEDASG